MQRIFLIGYMGSGKTTIGVVLAQKLRLSFIDLDQFIEQRYNKTVSQLFAEKGESQFREIESKVLHEISEFENVVISTGGGAPCFYDNMARINQAGVSIYLKISPLKLAKRLNVSKYSRPLIKDKTKEEMIGFISESLERREPFYLRARIVFDAEKMLADTDVEHLCNRLIEIIQNTQSNGNV